MQFNIPENFDLNSSLTYPIQYLKWYLNEKDLYSDEHVIRCTSRAETWNSSKAYLNGDTVQYAGKTYIAKWWTQGDKPNAKVNNPWETPWELADNDSVTQPTTPDNGDSTPTSPTTPDNGSSTPSNNNKVVYPDYSSVDVGKGIKWPKNVFAPFIDATAWPPLKFADNSASIGVPYFNLGFVVSKSASLCEPTWGTYYSAEAGPLNDQIKKIRSQGGDVLISFGGAANVPLHVTAPSVDVLKKQYSLFIKAFGLTRIDFDIEGTWVTDTKSLQKNSKALKLLESEFPDLEVWFTLPVLPSGLTPDGENVIKIALQENVKIRGINVMTMDYGDNAAPNPQNQMGKYGIDAITALHRQIKSIYSSFGKTLSDTAVWNMIGTTPMIGMNDVTTEIFTLQDAKTTLNFCEQKNVGMISMWSLNRDKQCSQGAVNYVSISCSSILQKQYEFSKTFNLFNDSSSFKPGTPEPTIPDTPSNGNGNGGNKTPSSNEWDSSKAYNGGAKVSYKGSTYEAKWWTQGDEPDKAVKYHWETPWKKL